MTQREQSVSNLRVDLAHAKVVFASSTVSTSPIVVPFGIIVKPNNSRATIEKQAADKETSDTEVGRLTKIIEEWAGTLSKYVQVMDKLAAKGLVKGSPLKHTNLRRVRSFFEIRTSKMDTRRKGDNLFLKFDLEDFEWWVLRGPSLGVVPVKQSAKVPIEKQRAQLFYYIDSVLYDRDDPVTARQYEAQAKQANLRPWSGDLISRIVNEAYNLRADQRQTGPRQKEAQLSPSEVQSARRSVFAKVQQAIDQQKFSGEDTSVFQKTFVKAKITCARTVSPLKQPTLSFTRVGKKRKNNEVDGSSIMQTDEEEVNARSKRRAT